MCAQRPASLQSSPPVYNSVPISTLPLYRRLLFPLLPPSSPTPPLFRHGTPELDVVTYELIAVILRSHVSPWYTRLTRDKTFVPQVSVIIAHLLREVERRILAADLALLAYTIIPALLTQHYRDYRAAASHHALCASTSICQSFNALQPHVSVAPGLPTVNEEYLRQMVERVLNSCLPKEDWDAETERTIVREVLVGPVLGNVLPRLSQPWFLFNLMLGVLGSKRRSGIRGQPTAKPAVTSTRQLLVLLIGVLHAITSTLHFAVTLLQSLSRFLASLPANNQEERKPRYYASNLLVLLATVFDLPSRLVSELLLSLFSIILALLQPLLDRILYHILHAHILTANNAASVVRRASSILYPNGAPAPPTVEPPAEEQLRTREQLETRLRDLLPYGIDALLMGPTPEARTSIAKEILAPLSDANCNLHLIMRLLDAILLTLFPEIAANVPTVPTFSITGPIADATKYDSDSESNREGFSTPLSH